MDRTLIANTTILDGSGAAPFPGDVLVEGQRIVAVQRGGGLPRGEARVIDGAGGTLMPGLIEPHGHVSYPDAARNSDFTRLPPEELMAAERRAVEAQTPEAWAQFRALVQSGRDAEDGPEDGVEVGRRRRH